jgi:ribosomal protein S18 acetylase RimI-like enzyme
MTTARINLDPMTESEFREFLAPAVAGYAEEKVTAGVWTPQESLDKSQAEFDQLLPQGLASPGNHLFTARDADSGEQVALVWFALRGTPGRQEAFIYEIEVREQFRGKGYGRATMQACAEAARRVGANSVGLHVFGHNTVARSLYTSLGFVETGVVMSLPLDGQ